MEPELAPSNLDRIPSRPPPPDQGDPGPSPFLEGTQLQFAWDSTCLGHLKKCPRYYQYKILEGWAKPGDAIHLRWGQEYHAALEDYDRSIAVGVKHDDAIHDTLRALLGRIEDWTPEPASKSEELKTKENLLRSVVWYFEHYNPDPAETFRLANGKPAVELSFQFEIDDGYLLCGHLDRVAQFSGDLYVMDRKTTSSTPGSYYFDQYHVNNQMSLYTLASQILLQSPIRGVIIDVVQVAVNFSRFTRGFTYRTPDQLEEWLEHTKSWLRLAEGYATEGFWPMNDTSCDKFGGCEFRSVCGKSPGVRDRFLESEFERREPWNPLKPR